MEQINDLARICNDNSFNLKDQMDRLKVIQTALAKLTERIGIIQHEGCHEDSAMAYLSMNEISQMVQLIEMAFHPLFEEMNGTVDRLHHDSTQLVNTVHADEKRIEIN